MRRRSGAALLAVMGGAALLASAAMAQAQAPAAPATPAAPAASAEPGAAAKAAKSIAFTTAPNFLSAPATVYLGEVAGVATNSKGHTFVFHRTGNQTLVIGANRPFAWGGSKLFEYGPDGKFIREIGSVTYGMMVAHAVRVDAQDNIWTVDEASNVIVKYDPQGRILMVMGRKPEAVEVPARGGPPAGTGLGVAGDTFNGPTDVAWDAQGNIFVSDGSRNARVVKFDKDGVYIKAWGGRGTGPGQFNNAHALAVDPQGNVYVADRGNNRIQVFDNDGAFKSQITGVGSPMTICIAPGAHPYLYSSNSNAEVNFDNGEIYKMELNGAVLGKFGVAGKLAGQFGTVHAMDCRTPNTVIVGEITNWRAQKLLLKP